jgi:hypothetical protein
MNWPIRQPAVPANCKGLDLAVVEQALVKTFGNVTAAARALFVSSIDLRKLVWATPSLADTVYEQLERAVDEAEAIILQGLRSQDRSQRIQAATFLLRHSAAARRRGWGKALRVETTEESLTLKWLEPGEAPSPISSSAREK